MLFSFLDVSQFLWRHLVNQQFRYYSNVFSLVKANLQPILFCFQSGFSEGFYNLSTYQASQTGRKKTALSEPLVKPIYLRFTDVSLLGDDTVFSQQLGIIATKK
ncbi:MAG: hypothetical protein AAF614_35070 [Chloroflexota bacterium]